MNYKIFLIPVLFLFSIYSTSAQENTFFEDFAITAPQSVEVYKCSPATAQFELANTGAVKSNYRVYLSGEASRWTSISPSIFSLEAGQKQRIIQTLNTPCDVLESNDLSVNVQTYSGIIQSFDQKINVFTPENIDARIKNDNASALSCEKALFEFELFNFYNFDETYSLSTDKFEEDSVFSPQIFTLPPGKSRNVSLSITPQDCTLSGDFSFNVIVSTKKSSIEGGLPFNLHFKSAHLVEIVPERESISLSNKENKSLTVLFNNKGDVPSVYELSVSGPDWIKLNTGKLVVNGKKSDSIKIDIKPNKDVAPGDYSAELTVKIKDTDKDFKKKFGVKIKTPFVASLSNYSGSLFSVIAVLMAMLLIGLVIFLTGKSKSRAKKKSRATKEKASAVSEHLKAKKEELEILESLERERKNPWLIFQKILGIIILITAVFSAGFLAFKYLSLLKQHWQYSLAGIVVLLLVLLAGIIFYAFKSEEQKIKSIEKRINAIKKREERRKSIEKQKIEEWKIYEQQRIKQDVDSEYRATNKIIPKSEIVENKKIEKEYRKFWRFSLIILLAGIAGFVYWKINAFISNTKFVLAGAGAVIFLALVKIIFFTGKAKNKWKVIFAGESNNFLTHWKKGLHTISFVLQRPAENLMMTAKKGKDKNIAIIPSKKVYKYFRINSNIPDDTFKELKVQFKVKTSWLSRREIPNSNVKLVHFINNRWVEIKAEFLNEDCRFSYFEATARSPGSFAVVGNPKTTAKKKKTGLIILGVLFTLAVIAVIILASTQKPYQPAKGIPDQSIDANSILRIDISKYFSDPDNDKLIFSASETEHLKIDFDGGAAIISPQIEWTGQESAVFSASDGKGGIADSNKVIFTIKKPLIPSQYFPWLINGGVAILLILIVVLLVKYKNQLLKFLDDE